MNEFWAAIIGAVVGALASGVSTWFFQKTELTRQETERNKALARSLLIKIVKICNDFGSINGHVSDCRQSAGLKNLDIGWTSLQAVASIPRKIDISNDELVFANSLKNDNFFNELLLLDSIHSTAIDGLSVYSTRRMKVVDQLPARMDGTVGTIELDADQHARFSPRFSELDTLAHDIAKTAGENVQKCKSILSLYCQLVEKTLGKSPQIEFTSDEPARLAG